MRDPDSSRAYQRAYTLAHREKKLAYNKAWREKNRDKAKARAREWRAKNPHGHREAHLQKLYGIGLEQYQKMYEEQRGACAICHRPPATDKRLVVDHCHSTGHVRALLCSQCNVAIGMMGDSADRLHAAGSYLDSFNEY